MNQTEGPSPLISEPTKSDELPKILVVDDTPANLIAMRRLLRGVDAQIIEATSGNEALAACLDHEFCLLLLDVQMPDMDGFEVASMLADEERTRDMPIIFVTAAFSDDMNRLKGYRHGAIDYIAKPVNDAILLSKVRIFLELYSARQGMRRLLNELEQRNAMLEKEVTERRRLEELARHQAGHDALTGLPNRLLFMDRLLAAANQADRRRDPSALLYIDLDGFKPINDRYGHQVGDETLQIVAKRLRQSTRKADTCARLGGDEFAVIMNGAPRGAAEAMAENLCEALREKFVVKSPTEGEIRLGIGASIGIAMFPDLRLGQAEGMDVEARIETLIRHADEAMYAAKKSGKNRYHLAAGFASD